MKLYILWWKERDLYTPASSIYFINFIRQNYLRLHQYHVLVPAQSSITALTSFINCQSICLHTCSRSESTLMNSDVCGYLYATQFHGSMGVLKVCQGVVHFISICTLFWRFYPAKYISWVCQVFLVGWKFMGSWFQTAETLDFWDAVLWLEPVGEIWITCGYRGPGLHSFYSCTHWVFMGLNT